MKKIINAKYYAQDCGDGSQSFAVYPDLEILKEEAFENLFEPGEDLYEGEQKRLDEMYEQALEGINSYEYGEIGDIQIEVNVDEATGEVTLAKSFYASLG